MTDLFGNVLAERPTHYTTEMSRGVAEKLLDQVISWLRQGGDESALGERDEIMEQLAEAIDDSRFYDCDGFRIAKSLSDDHYWDCDSALVDILDQASWMLSTELNLAVKAWVKANLITPKFEKGWAVKFIFGNKTLEGTITAVDQDQATYTIYVPELGHIPPQEVGTRSGTTGIILPFEKVEVAHA